MPGQTTLSSLPLAFWERLDKRPSMSRGAPLQNNKKTKLWLQEWKMGSGREKEQCRKGLNHPENHQKGAVQHPTRWNAALGECAGATVRQKTQILFDMNELKMCTILSFASTLEKIPTYFMDLEKGGKSLGVQISCEFNRTEIPALSHTCMPWRLPGGGNPGSCISMYLIIFLKKRCWHGGNQAYLTPSSGYKEREGTLAVHRVMQTLSYECLNLWIGWCKSTQLCCSQLLVPQCSGYTALCRHARLYHTQANFAFLSSLPCLPPTRCTILSYHFGSYKASLHCCPLSVTFHSHQPFSLETPLLIKSLTVMQ